MQPRRLRAARLAAHALPASESGPVAAARRLAATQAQEFWAGRWALGIRTEGEPTLADVDGAFARGDLVRSWTQRGTLHIVAAEDLAWILSVTRERQQRQTAGVHRRLGIDADDIARAERADAAAPAGGKRLTPADVSTVDAAAGGELDGGMSVVWSLAAQGIAVILVEHVMTAVRALCGRVVVMNAGLKIAEGPPVEVLRDPEVVRAYLGDDMLEAGDA